jgi:uncharacterized protein (DUF1919 family)
MIVKKKKLKNNTYKIISYDFVGGGIGVEFFKPFEPFEEYILEMEQDDYIKSIDYQQFDKEKVQVDKFDTWRACTCNSESSKCYLCDLVNRYPSEFLKKYI